MFSTVAVLVFFAVATAANGEVTAAVNNGTDLVADAGRAAGNNTPFSIDTSWCLTPEWHFDYPSEDSGIVPARSYEECCDFCGRSLSCGAYTWSNYNGGTCYMKNWRGQSVWAGANADGSAHTISGEYYRCAALMKDFDFVGVDIDNVPATGPNACCQICYNRRLCFGFSWTDYNGGTCWLKGEGLQPVYKPGVVSANKWRPQ